MGPRLHLVLTLITSLTVIAAMLLILSVSPIQWALIVAFQSLALLLFFLLYKNSPEKERHIQFDYQRLIDYALAMCTLTLLLLNLASLQASYLNIVLATIATSYLPGWTLIRMTSVFRILKGVENLLLPFVLSIPISGLMLSIFLTQSIDNSFLILPYVILSLLPLAKAGPKHETQRLKTITYSTTTVLALTWIVTFLSLAIIITYPNMAIIPDLDIVRHYSYTRLLSSIPGSYIGAELWFHTQWASIFVLSQPSTLQTFQTAIAFLSIFSILSFYLMSRKYLAEINRNLPTLATLLWTAFAGFGWLYYLQTKIENPAPALSYNLLADASNKSYWDVGYSQGWIWLWYRPLTLGLTFFFTLLYILKEDRLDRRSFIFIFTLLLTTLNFVHFSESIVLVAFLLVLSLLKPHDDLRLKEAAISSSFAMLISLPLALFYQNAVGMRLTAPSLDHLALLGLVGLSCVFISRFGRKPRLKRWIPVQWMAFGFSLLYAGLLITWLTTANDFSVSYVGDVLSVPWQFYPMLLGIAGLFAIISSGIILMRHLKSPVVIFPLLLVFVILFGRAVSFYNLSVVATGYWERRFIPIAYAAACIVAPLSIVEIFHRMRRKTIITTTFLVSLVVFGTLSTSLTLERQFNITQQYHLTDEELETVAALNELPNDKALLTVTDYSKSIAEFAPSSWMINKYRYQLWPAKSPELPLSVLYAMNKPVTVFMQQADRQEIDQKYASGYLASHLLPLSESGSLESEIITLPKMTAPSSDSTTLLVMPEKPDSTVWCALDMLSQANLNYSTVLIDDINTISRAKTLIAPTESVAIQVASYQELFNLEFENLVVLNLDGYGNLASDLFSNPKLTLSIDEDSKGKAILNVDGVEVGNFTKIVSPQVFEVHSAYTDGPLYSLLDDDFEGWVASGIGSGNISQPILSLNNSTRIYGQSSIQMDVASGAFGYWQLSKSFPAIDVESYDFVSFYWHGTGNSKNYVLNFHSASPNNFWYFFKDTWIGWKEVVIPMHVPDGSYTFNGVNIVKATNGEPTWTNIRKVEIRNEGSNPNLSGTFLIDKLSFESAETVNVVIVADDPVYGFELLNYNGTEAIKLAEITSNGTVSITDYALMSTTASKMIFGDHSLMEITMAQVPGSPQLAISVRLPPNLGNDISSSIKLEIIPITHYRETSEINGSGNSLQLNTKVNVIPLETHSNVIASYGNGQEPVPFAVDVDAYTFNTIYVNIYPITVGLLSETKNYELLGIVTGLIGLDQLMSKAQPLAENPVRGNLATFTEADFIGSVTAYTGSSLITKGLDGNITLILPNVTISGLSKIIANGNGLAIETQTGYLRNGTGFYSCIYSNDLLASSATGVIPQILLEFSNGSRRIINEPSQNFRIVGNSVTVVRQPTLQIEGTVAFHELYTYASLSSLGIFGKDASLDGVLTLNVIYGDEFTVTDNFAYKGELIISSKDYSYDELKVLFESLPTLLVVGFLFSSTYILALMTIKKKEPTGLDT